MIDVETEYPNVWNVRKPATPIDRIRCKWVVIAGENNDGFAVIAQNLRCAFKKIDRLTVIVKSISSEDDDVRRASIAQRLKLSEVPPKNRVR